MQGWIKLHRKLLEKPIWTASTPEQKVILITLLTMANHTGKEWEFNGEKYKAEPGQFVTSLKSIVANSGVGISIQNVRTALARFEKYEFLTSTSTNKNRLITIVNWGFYQQNNDDLTSNLTSNQQATNKQLTTNKNERMKELKDLKDSSSVKFSFHDMENARLLFDLILENNPDAKHPNLDKWADTFRLMRERDKRKDDAIKYLIQWSQNDSFWKGIILSPTNLRKQYDRLVVIAKEEHELKQKAKVVPIGRLKPDFNAIREELEREEE